MDERLTDAVEDIRNMEVRGAAAIGRHAARALGALAKTASTPSDDLRAQLEVAGAHLKAARPTAVSLENAVDYVLRGLEADDPAASVAQRADEFVERSLEARDAASGNAAALLTGPVVLTICNSQAAVEAIAKAHAAGRIERAMCFETRPWRQGLITARQLVDAGVPTTYMVDSAVSLAVEEAGSCVIGADTLVRNGDVVNKIGSKLLALAAHDAGIPYYVCAESFKAHPSAGTGKDVPIEERPTSEVVDPADLPDVEVRNPVFDITPPDLVTRICTELGADEPVEAVQRALREWR